MWLIIVTVGVIFSITLALMQLSRYRNDHSALVNQQLENANTFVTGKLALYEEILLAASGFVNVNGRQSIDDIKWQKFTTDIQLEKRYPELMGLGLTDYIKSEDVARYSETVRQATASNFTITPTGIRPEYTAIRYLQPDTEANKHAVGYDMFSEPNRNQAMLFARDNGTFGLTQGVVAVQDQNRSDKKRPLSVLMYYPIFNQSTIPASVEERRQQLVGYVYLVFRVEDILNELKGSLAYYPATVRLSDSTAGGTFLHQFSSDGTNYSVGANAQSKPILVANREWQVALDIRESIYDKVIDPLAIAIGGILVSLFISSFAYRYLFNRVKELQETHEIALQKTKDDLLALASHQLRTPASGVRQYLAMLKQGYFGNLTTDQEEIADKAYMANELQLDIIDQILYVAEADAGQLLVSFERMDIAQMIRQVVDGFSDEAGRKNITIIVKGKDSLECHADPRYVRMIIENLISNAIKYSYDESSVVVSVRKVARTIEFSVRDRGVGIAEKDRGKLFTKFSRINNPLSGVAGGNGLGLFLVDKLVQSHHGSISVSSVPGKGSVFKVRIPCQNRTGSNVVKLTE